MSVPAGTYYIVIKGRNNDVAGGAAKSFFTFINEYAVMETANVRSMNRALGTKTVNGTTIKTLGDNWSGYPQWTNGNPTYPRDLQYIKLGAPLVVDNTAVQQVFEITGRENTYIDKVFLVPEAEAADIARFTTPASIAAIDAIEAKDADNITATFKGVDGSTIATLVYDKKLAGNPIPTTIDINRKLTNTNLVAPADTEDYEYKWDTTTLPATSGEIKLVAMAKIPDYLLSDISYTVEGGEPVSIASSFDSANGYYEVAIPRDASGKKISVSATVADQRASATSATVTLDKATNISELVFIDAKASEGENYKTNRYGIKLYIAAPAVEIVPGINADTSTGDAPTWEKMVVGSHIIAPNAPFAETMELFNNRGHWWPAAAGAEIQNSYLLARVNARTPYSMYGAVTDNPATEDVDESKSPLLSFVAPEDGVLIIPSRAIAYNTAMADAGFVMFAGNVAYTADGKNIHSVVESYTKADGTVITTTVDNGKIRLFNTLPYDYVPESGNGKNDYLYHFMPQQVADNGQLFKNAIRAYENGSTTVKPIFAESAALSQQGYSQEKVWRKAFKAGETVVVPRFDGSSLQDTATVFVKWAAPATDASATVTVNEEVLVADEVTGEYAYEVEVGGVAHVDVEAASSLAHISVPCQDVEEFPAKVTVTVTAEDNTKKDYVINLTEAAVQVKLSVVASGDGVVVDAENNPVAESKNYDVNSTVVLKAVANEGSSFAHWVDEFSGRIVSAEPEYSVLTSTAKTLTAVFVKDAARTVIFKNANGQIYNISNVEEGGQTFVMLSDEPYYMGYEFAGWKKDGVVVDIDLIEGATIAYEDLSDGVNVYTAYYTRKTDAYELTVTNGVAMPAKESYNYDEKVVVKANGADEGKKFSHWIKENNNIVSYNESYSFYIGANDTSVEAVYVDESEEIVAAPILAMTTPVVLAGEGRIAFFAERDLGEGRELVETGIMVSMSTDEFDIESADAVATSTSKAGRGQFTVRKAKLNDGDTVYARAYMVYIENGEMKTVISNVVEGTYAE